MDLKFNGMGMLGAAVALGAMLVGCAPWPTKGPIQYMTDKEFNHKVKHVVEAAVPRDFANLKITTIDYYVKFAGRFGTEDNRKRAVDAARKVAGVRDVLDYTVVMPARAEPPPKQVTLAE